MPAQFPKIDPRSYDEVVAQTERLAQHFSPWRPPAVGSDLGRALIGVFARMAEQAIERLNQVPEQNFLAFLDLIGARRLPPLAARAPLSFLLAGESRQDGFVPARTRVAAPAGPAGAEALFETERDLVVTRSRLVAAIVHEPGADRYNDATAAATGLADTPFPAFAGDKLIEHCLYLAHDDLLTLPSPRTISLAFTLADSAACDAFANLPIEWSRWDGDNWRELDAPSPAGSADGPRRWVVDLGDLVTPAPQTIAGASARWIRARLVRAIGLVGDVPPILDITFNVKMSREPTLPPDQAFANFANLDLSKDFFPFGERPSFNDTFYIASREAFARHGALVTLNVSPSQASKATLAGSPSLAWEAWDGSRWQSVVMTTDETKEFTESGDLKCSLPATMGVGSVNGQTSFWLRARLVGGNYGAEAHFTTTTTTTATTTTTNYSIVPATFAPPSIARLQLGYSYTSIEPPQLCLTRNDFSYVDHTNSINRNDGAGFTPFTPSANNAPALYLGFDQPFANRPTLLYAQVEPAPYHAANVGAVAPHVAWEYATASGWAQLEAQDEAHAFTRPGLIAFIGPRDFAGRTEFEQRLYWLRVSAHWEEHAREAVPTLRRVLTNTIWASQSVSLRDELMGSSDGTPSQAFRTTQAPVLAGQQIEVRERELPAPAERIAIIAQEGYDAVSVTAEGGRADQAWVRWHAVTDFYGSGPRDRHYTFDCMSGELRFGDGRQGLIPPAGSSIRAASYQAGGGVGGNRAAGMITQLKTALPSIDGVSNYEAAAGGADPEPLDRVKERGPAALRHGGRAVAFQDYEDLAYAASPEVARALALPPPANPFDIAWLATDTTASEGTAVNQTTVCRAAPEALATRLAEAASVAAGQVGLIVVPRNASPQPIPSLELIERVKQYILARCPAALGPNDLQVAGPDWLKVTVTIRVAPLSPSAADRLRGNLAGRLRRFLHPLIGGHDGRGWAFGRLPHQSDLYALIEAAPGVDYVYSLRVQQEPESPPPERLSRVLIYSGDHEIVLIAPGEGA